MWFIVNIKSFVPSVTDAWAMISALQPFVVRLCRMVEVFRVKFPPGWKTGTVPACGATHRDSRLFVTETIFRKHDALSLSIGVITRSKCNKYVVLAVRGCERMFDDA